MDTILWQRVRDLESKIKRLEQAEARKPLARIKDAFFRIFNTFTKQGA